MQPRGGGRDQDEGHLSQAGLGQAGPGLGPVRVGQRQAQGGAGVGAPAGGPSAPGPRAPGSTRTRPHAAVRPACAPAIAAAGCGRRPGSPPRTIPPGGRPPRWTGNPVAPARRRCRPSPASRPNGAAVLPERAPHGDEIVVARNAGKQLLRPGAGAQDQRQAGVPQQAQGGQAHGRHRPPNWAVARTNGSWMRIRARGRRRPARRVGGRGKASPPARRVKRPTVQCPARLYKSERFLGFCHSDQARRIAAGQGRALETYLFARRVALEGPAAGDPADGGRGGYAAHLAVIMKPLLDEGFSGARPYYVWAIPLAVVGLIFLRGVCNFFMITRWRGLTITSCAASARKCSSNT